MFVSIQNSASIHVSTALELATFLNTVQLEHAGLSLQTGSFHIACDAENVEEVLSQFGVYRCRKGGCPQFQTDSPKMLCWDCYEDKYRPYDA
jgi:hypothetical protein